MEVSRYVGNGNDVKKLLIGNKVDQVEDRKVSTEAIAVSRRAIVDERGREN